MDLCDAVVGVDVDVDTDAGEQPGDDTVHGRLQGGLGPQQCDSRRGGIIPGQRRSVVCCVQGVRDIPAWKRDTNVTRQAAAASERAPPLWSILTSTNLLLAMFQYIASNVTFFISFTWLLPYLQSRWGTAAAALAPVTLVAGALAQWFSGWLVTK